MSRYGWTLVLLSVALLILVSTSVVAEIDVYASGVVQGKYLYDTGLEREIAVDETTTRWVDYDASVADVRVDIDVVVGPVTLGAAYRAYLLSDEDYNPAKVVAPPTEVKHRYIAFEHEDVNLRAGHFFATFGHGLTLRSYEEIALEHDTALDGVLAEYAMGDVSLTALSGAATDNVEGSRYYEHVVSAARVSAPFTEYAEVAGSIVERSRTQKDDEIAIQSEVARMTDVLVGTELSVWAGPLSFVAEYVKRDGENPMTLDDEIQGHALYASGTLGLGGLMLFGEFKDYEDYQHYLVSPPTGVHDHLWTQMNRVTYQPYFDDERGFLVEGSGTLGDALFLTGGASSSRNHDSDLRHWEMFGQLDWTMGETISGSAAGSWSKEYLFDVEEATGEFDEHMSGALSAEFGIGTGSALEVTLEGQATEDRYDASYEDYLVSLAFYAAGDWTLIATAERTTSETEAREGWFMAEARKLVTDDLEVSVAAGTERRGLKCAGGVCFEEPEFEGVRLRFTSFF
ncbi:MAG: DUF6029 family protein [Candidatus Eisenbacteria bacterium]